jgi:hypothetical protein
LGRFSESDEICRELEPLAQLVGHLGALALIRRSGFPKLAAQSADLGALESLSATQAKAATQLGRGWLAYSSTLHGILALWRGDWGVAGGHMKEGTRLAVPGHWFGPHHGFLIVLLSLAGEREEALTVLNEVRDALPTPGRANAIGQWNLAILAAEALGILCDGDRARALHPLVVEAMATGTVLRQYDGALLARSAGMVAAAAGLAEQAEDHFETALRQAEELPHLMEQPYVRHFYGRFLMKRGGSGDSDRARILLEEAKSGFRTIGMARHQAMAEELLMRMDGSGA